MSAKRPEHWNRPESSGERQGARGAIERMTGQLVQAGHSHDAATQKARESAIRHDRRESNKKR